MKIAKKIAIVLVVALIALQFFIPDKNSAEGDYVAAFESETKPGQDVQRILETTCYDCHSNNTVYPWYNNVALVSFWLDHHIEEGKEHLNFSDWENYSKKKKNHKLEELIEEVEEGEMPLKEYTWTHDEAKLTPEQQKVLMDWASDTRKMYQTADRPK